MMNELEYVLKQLKERGEIVSERVGTGGAKDYAEYRDLCGQIQGLLFAQSVVIDLVRKMERYEDD
jgi:hypothetical protein